METKRRKMNEFQAIRRFACNRTRAAYCKMKSMRIIDSRLSAILMAFIMLAALLRASCERQSSATDEKNDVASIKRRTTVHSFGSIEHQAANDKMVINKTNSSSYADRTTEPSVVSVVNDITDQPIMAFSSTPMAALTANDESNDDDNNNNNNDDNDDDKYVHQPGATTTPVSEPSTPSMLADDVDYILAAGSSSTPSSITIHDDHPSSLESPKAHESVHNVESRRQSEPIKPTQSSRNSSDALTGTTVIRNSRKSPDNSSATTSAATSDYDDFDLDYQLKLPSNDDQHQQEMMNASKRDQELPAWSALVANQPHVFTSVSQIGGAQNKSVTRDERQLHQAAPIAPAVLTAKSQQLSEQELARLRSHLLLAYEGDSGAELLAHGDLLATASGGIGTNGPLEETASIHGNDSFVRSSTISPLSIGVGEVGLARNTTPGHMISLMNAATPTRNVNIGQESSTGRPSWPTSRYAARPMLQPHLNPELTTIVVDNGASTSEFYTETPLTTSTSTTSSTNGQPPPPASSTSSSNSSSGSTNSSQSNQWFSYPHPNLHNNPLLLHHILNKPASFYGAAPMTSSSTTSTTTEQPATTTITATTTTTTTPANTTPNSLSTVNIIERPTLSAAHAPGQQAVNLTLLQMQLNEMHSIAANRAVPKTQFTWQQSNGNEQHQHRTISSTFAPATGHWSSDAHGTKSPLHVYNKPLTNRIQPTSFPGQVMAAPSFLQQVYTPRPIELIPNSSLTSMQTKPQSSSAKLSDEDMSTYVALLASLSSAAQSPKQTEPTGLDSSGIRQASDGRNSATKDEQQQQLALLLHLIAKSKQAHQQAKGEQHAPQTVQQAMPLRALDLGPIIQNIESSLTNQQQHKANEHNKSNAWLSLLRGAKLVGLSDEVQAQLYRDHFASILSASPQIGTQAEHHKALQEMASLPRANSADSSNKDTVNLAIAQLQAASQQYKHMAFVEALRASLARLQANGQQQFGLSMNNKPTIYNSTVSGGDLMSDSGDTTGALKWNISNGAGGDDFDETISVLPPNSSTIADNRPTSQHAINSSSWPGGSEKQIIEDSFLHETIRSMPFNLAANRARFQVPAPPAQLRPLGPLVGPLQPAGFAPVPSRPPIGTLRPIFPIQMSPSARVSTNIAGAYGAASMQTAPNSNRVQTASTISSMPMSVAPAPALADQRPITPSRIMLDRFSLANAPAYMLKWPTLAGGTITTSASLQPPMAPSTRIAAALRGVPFHQQQRPAAFISASPVGALRFLGTIAPPRLRAPPIGSPYYAPVRLNGTPTPMGLGSSASTLHVQHHHPGRLFGYRRPHATVPFSAASMAGHLYPMPHIQHHTHQYHYAPAPLQMAMATQPARLVAPHQQPPEPGNDETVHNNNNNGETFSIPDQSNTAETGTPKHSSASTNQQANPRPQQLVVQPSHQVYQGTQAVGDYSMAPGSAQPLVSAYGGPPLQQQHQQSQQLSGPGAALARLQQATASLVELTSIASLVEEMVKDNEMDSSPAVALANAINTISASSQGNLPRNQNQLQGSQSNSVPAQQSGTGTEQQQAVSGAGNGNNQQPFSWKNLLSWRGGQSGGKTSSASGKLRDLSALLATMSGSQSGQSNGAGRVRVKYIRVPVAVYETSGPNGVTHSNEVALLNPGTVASLGPDTTRQLTSKTQLAELNGHSIPQQQQQQHQAQQDNVQTSSRSRHPNEDSNNSASQQSDGLTGASLNDLHYDEMSAESGAHHQYMRRPLIGTLTPHAGPILLDESPTIEGLYSAASSLNAQQTIPKTRQKLNNVKANKKRNRRGKKKKKGLLSISSHYDDNNNEDERENDEDEDDGDDVLSTSDLPVLESLISALVHGPPFLTAHAGHANPILYQPLSPAPSWSPRLAGLRGTLLASESSPLISYATAGPGMAHLSGTRSASKLGQQLSASLRHRGFSLGETVGGVLGARKLISSLFTAHQYRDSKRKQSLSSTSNFRLGSTAASNKRVAQLSDLQPTIASTNALSPPFAGALNAAVSTVALAVRDKVRHLNVTAPPHGNNDRSHKLQASKMHAINFPSIAAYDASSKPSFRRPMKKRTAQRENAPGSMFEHQPRNTSLNAAASGQRAVSIAGVQGSLVTNSKASDGLSSCEDQHRLSIFIQKQNDSISKIGDVKSRDSVQEENAKPSRWLGLEDKNNSPMPLYHIVADHYNKQNGGKLPALRPTTKMSLSSVGLKEENEIASNNHNSSAKTLLMEPGKSKREVIRSRFEGDPGGKT